MSVLFSLVIASGVDPNATWFQKRKIPRVLVVIFVYLIAFSFLGGMFYLIIPNTFKELTSFADNLPSYLEKPFETGTVDKIFGNLPSFVRDALGGFLGNIADYVSSFSVGFFGIASAAVGGAVSFILIIVLSFYLSMQENGVENFLKIVIPPARKLRRRLMAKMEKENRIMAPRSDIARFYRWRFGVYRAYFDAG